MSIDDDFVRTTPKVPGYYWVKLQGFPLELVLLGHLGGRPALWLFGHGEHIDLGYYSRLGTLWKRQEEPKPEQYTP